MIIQALCDYYSRKAALPESDIAPFGWSKKEIHFLIDLSLNGDFLGITDTRELVGKKKRGKRYLVPSPVKRSSGISPNFIWDNLEYVTGIAKESSKPERVLKEFQEFKARIKSFLKVEELGAIYKFLDSEDFKLKLEKSPIWPEVIEEKAPSLSFSVGGKFIFNYESVKEVVDRQASSGKGTNNGICLVTGRYGTISKLHPSIAGVTGTVSTGGNIVSFNKAAFCSYGKEQGLNSPIGGAATFEYTTALNSLLGKDSSQKLTIGGTTTVFWAKKENCPLEEQLSSFFAEPPKDNPDRLSNNVESMFKAIETGAYSGDEGKTGFCILGLSPNAARISIRYWYDGQALQLAENLASYFKDTTIVHVPKEKEHLSLWRLLVSTAAGGESKNILPHLAGDIVKAIIAGRPFPQTLLQAAILRCSAERNVGYPRAKLIKGFLNRKYRFTSVENIRSLKVSLDNQNFNVGYLLGRLFAALEKIQEEANPGGKNASTIRDRYYGAASTSPIMVFQNLLRMKNYHIEKLSVGRKFYFEKLIGQILEHIQNFPAHLCMDDQGRFAIGYYHQRNEFFSKNSDN